jgi:RNA polymerase sigma-70 factor (ECF subfamily)
MSLVLEVFANESKSNSGPWANPERWREVFAELVLGKHEALGLLSDMASSRLYRLALWRTGNHEDACEVVQEVFVRVAREHARLNSVSDPRWWLLAVAHRIAIDVTRRRRRHQTEPVEKAENLAAPVMDVVRTLDADRAWNLIQQLSPKQREVIFLHHFAELSFAEISRCLGVPTFTAASRHRLAIAALRRLLGGKHELQK